MKADLKNLNLKSKLSVFALLIAYVVCYQACAIASSKLSSDSNCVKVLDKALSSCVSDAENLNYTISTNFKIKFITVNNKVLFFELTYFNQLSNTLKARGPPLA